MAETAAGSVAKRVASPFSFRLLGFRLLSYLLSSEVLPNRDFTAMDLTAAVALCFSISGFCLKVSVPFVSSTDYYVLVCLATLSG